VPTRHERVSDDIYVFTSNLYAEVTASVIFTKAGAVVVDTLPFPQESRELQGFVRSHGANGVCYVINTHFHADHTYGSYLFPEAELVAHRRCRDLQVRYGEAALVAAKEETLELAEVQIRLPGITFDGSRMILRLGGKTIVLSHAPGHSPDLATVYVKEDKVLIASDLMMPVPYVVQGDVDAYIQSLEQLQSLPVESLVQGHGDVLLRGEIDEAVQSSIIYLQTIQKVVADAIARGLPRKTLLQIDIESCGKSRVPLGGLVQRLHEANLLDLYDRMVSGKMQKAVS